MDREPSASAGGDRVALHAVADQFLRGDLAGIYSARRGTYRVLYRINEDLHEVVVLRIDHRRDVYRGS